MRRLIFAIVLSFAATVSTLGQNSPPGQVGREPRGQAAKLRKQPGNSTDRYVVMLSDAATGRRGPKSRAVEVSNALAQAHGISRIDRVFSRTLNAFVAELTEQQAEALSRDPAVAYVEQDVEIRGEAMQSVQSVPIASSNWGLDRIDQPMLPANGEYHFSNDGTGVKAYIVDSGIRASHQEFGGRVILGPDFVTDDPGNPHPDTSLDCFGHGTHVAGVVGGATFGVAKNVTLVAVRVLNCQGAGSSVDLINAIDWVTQDHIANFVPAVANLSLTTDTVPASFTAIEDAVANSIMSGVTWVLSAGNHGDWVSNHSPARLPIAITVGATYTYAGAHDVRAPFSNFGPEIDLFAPGIGITSAWYTDDQATAEFSGTSIAAPQVTGVVARFLNAYWWAPPGHVYSQVVWVNATRDIVWDAGPSTPNRMLYSGFLDW